MSQQLSYRGDYKQTHQTLLKAIEVISCIFDAIFALRLDLQNLIVFVKHNRDRRGLGNFVQDVRSVQSQEFVVSLPWPPFLDLEGNSSSGLFFSYTLTTILTTRLSISTRHDVVCCNITDE